MNIKPSKVYNWDFSWGVYRAFEKVYPRATKFFQAIFGTSSYFPVKLFREEQKRWELFKRSVIFLSKVIKKADFSLDDPEDLALLYQKLLYFLNIEGLFEDYDEELLNKCLVLTRISERVQLKRTV